MQHLEQQRWQSDSPACSPLWFRDWAGPLVNETAERRLSVWLSQNASTLRPDQPAGGSPFLSGHADAGTPPRLKPPPQFHHPLSNC